MTKTYFGLFFSTVFIFFSFCCCSKTTKTTLPETSSYKKLAKEKFGENFAYRFNHDSTYVLCLKQSKLTQKEIFQPLEYFIYDLRNSEMVFEDKLPNGNANWLNPYQVQISWIPGIVTKDEKANEKLTGYIYDLKLRKKIRNQNMNPDRRK